ncbi:hypothetical protein HYX06_03705 [Candidatus Woesearchaeota archaeon]|nr:hypothetical protein [Candidatus Woesearchaeota archaeon]
MTMKFVNLEEARNEMLAEFEIDIQQNKLYTSSRLKEDSAQIYYKLLKEAIIKYNEAHITSKIRTQDLLKTHMPRRTPSGGTILAKVPIDAPETLAEGEFNRFYVRGVCKLAIQKNKRVIAYRAKDVMQPRIESQAKIGQPFNPESLLEDLRKNVGVDTALGVPAGPNSGLSIKLEE